MVAAKCTEFLARPLRETVFFVIVVVVVVILILIFSVELKFYRLAHPDIELVMELYMHGSTYNKYICVKFLSFGRI